MLVLVQFVDEWPGLPKGVKFDPSDQELLWHLLAKIGKVGLKPHAFIDEFIPTIDSNEGLYYTHRQKLPGQQTCLLMKFIQQMSCVAKVVTFSPQQFLSATFNISSHSLNIFAWPPLQVLTDCVCSSPHHIIVFFFFLEMGSCSCSALSFFFKKKELTAQCFYLGDQQNITIVNYYFHARLLLLFLDNG